MIKKNLTLFSVILTLFSIFYFYFISIYSINKYDSGFIISYIGRLKAGQIIYKDFDYVRPFLGIIFWDFWLSFVPIKSDFLILFSRIFVVIESVIIVSFIQKILFERINFYVTFFLAICFLHSFPIMLWHTIDGVLFSVLGIYFFKKNYYFSSLLMVLFACLVKQSFFPFGLVFFGLIILKQFRHFKFVRKDLYLFVSISAVFIFSLFHYQIIDNIPAFVTQVFRSSTSSGFYNAAIKPYFFDKIIYNILFSISLSLLYFIKIKRIIIDYSLVVIFTVLLVLPFFNNGIYQFTHQVFIILLLFFIKYNYPNKLVYLLFLLGWSSAISWGYYFPTFFVFIFIYVFIEPKNKFFHFLWLISISLFLSLRIVFTYFSDNIINSKYIFVKNTKAISGLLISENEYNYISEAKNLNKEFKNIIFVPGSPLLDVINNSYPNRASWEMDVEYPNWKKDMEKQKNNFIALDNEQSFKEGFYKSSFTKAIIENKKIIKKTKYFTIYGN